MRLSIFGLGYVGSVTAACLSSVGHEVIGVDVNASKAEVLNSGRSPVVEAGVDELVAEGRRTGRLHATTDAEFAIQNSEVSFLCVATPSLRNGKLDLSSVERVCQDIAIALRAKSAFHTVVVRSTVLPGTTERLVIPTLEATSGKESGKHFGVCMNPEFLREGSAVADFRNPPLTVIGSMRAEHAAVVRELYSSVSGEVFETTIAAAEMLKYVCNAYHALKVSFANEIGTMCRSLGIDPAVVIDIFTRDTKLNIAKTYLRPGFAFGGSCLPKDLRAVIYRAKELDLHLPLLQAILPSNNEHLERAVQAILATEKRKIAVLGLSFKAGTDDLRESPSVVLIKRLLGEGCHVQVWDEEVSMGRLIGSNRQFIESVIPHIGSLLCHDMGAAIAAADLVLIATDAVKSKDIRGLLRTDQTVVDLTRLETLKPAALATAI